MSIKSARMLNCKKRKGKSCCADNSQWLKTGTSYLLEKPLQLPLTSWHISPWGQVSGLCILLLNKGLGVVALDIWSSIAHPFSIAISFHHCCKWRSMVVFKLRSVTSKKSILKMLGPAVVREPKAVVELGGVRSSHSIVSQGDSVKLICKPDPSVEVGDSWVSMGERGVCKISWDVSSSSAALLENPSIIPSKCDSSPPIFRRVISLTLPRGLWELSKTSRCVSLLPGQWSNESWDEDTCSKAADDFGSEVLVFPEDIVIWGTFWRQERSSLALAGISVDKTKQVC